MQLIAYMAPTVRTRDQIWRYALTATALSGSVITQEDVVEKTDASLRTVRETLSVMSATPFLRRKQDLDGSVRYVRGSAFERDSAED